MFRALPLLALIAACNPPIADEGTNTKSSGGGGEDDTGELTGDDTGTQDEDPVAVITAPDTARAGELITLDGSDSYDPQGYELTDFEWSCSDGSTAEGESAELRFADAGDVTCTLTVTSESGLSDDASQGLTIDQSDLADWTIMVFINGDNNLEDAGIEDMNEMEQVGSTERVHIVTQFDRSSGYVTTEGNWTTAKRFHVEADDEPNRLTSTEIEDLGEVDSGDPQTAIDFVEWAATSYPAEHYMLVFWDHGWGWSMVPDEDGAMTKGISSDDSSGQDISVAGGELETILEAATDILGQPLDILGMDACIMQSWEVAHVSAPYADVYVSSQYYEDWDGWPYETAMADVVDNPDITAQELGASIALRFYESGDSTQSAIDLARMDAFDTALDNLATAILAADSPRDVVSGSARDAQSFEYTGAPDRDIGDFLDNLLERAEDDGVANAAGELQAVYDDMVLASYVNGNHVRDATGMSIYLPTRNFSPLYLEGTWAEDTLWDDMLTESLGGGPED